MAGISPGHFPPAKVINSDLMKNKNILLPISLVIAFAFISIVALVNMTENPTSVRGGFNRKTPIPILEQNNVVKTLGPELINLSGTTKFHNYFFTSQFTNLLETDNNLANPKIEIIRIDSKARINLNDTLVFTTYVDSPQVIVFLENSNAIIYCTLNKNTSTVYNLSTKFTNGVKLPGTSVLIRSLDAEGKNLLFQKINLQTKQNLDESNITDRLDDGGFATDGKLSYNINTGLAVYTHYYCNKITVFDTNLIIKSRFKTIDTFSKYQASAIRIGDPRHPRGYTFDRPPVGVNDWSTVVNNRIYINSTVIANNENPQKFAGNSVVDVYDLLSGQYLSSFYVPRLNGRKFRRFEIDKNQLIAIYPHSIAVSYFLYH